MMRYLKDTSLSSRLVILLASGALVATAAVAVAQDKVPEKDPCHPKDAVEVARAMHATPVVVEEGRKSFAKRCSACHGNEGRGDGAIAGRLEVKPPSLREGLTATSSAAIFSAISSGHTRPPVKGIAQVPAEERWAIAHYVRAEFVPTSALKATTADERAQACLDMDPEEKPVCKPEVKKDLQGKLAHTPEMLKRGKEIYDSNCSSCHGEKGLGDGLAAVALNPKPRNFATEEFKKGNAAFALFNTLANGLEGTAMPGFADQISEADRWAATHYVRESLIPNEKLEKATDKQVNALCVELSKPPRDEPIPLELAMEIMVEEANTSRANRHKSYGAVQLNAAGDEKRGESVYGALCVKCHGVRGAGVKDVGRYGRFPYVEVSTRSMTNEVAGGNYKAFTGRLLGYHQTIPQMTSVGALADDDFKSLHTYLAKSLRKVSALESDEPKSSTVALISASADSELLFYNGKVFKLTHPKGNGFGALSRVLDYAEFKSNYKGAAALPEFPPAGGLDVPAFVGLDCLAEPDESGKRGFCTSAAGGRSISVRVKLASTQTAAPEEPEP